MGTFLSFTLVHKSINETKKAILEYSRINQGDYIFLPDSSISEENILYSNLKSIDKQTSIVLLPTFSIELYDCAKSLSTNQDAKVLAAHVYDGDVWIIYLFDKGQELTRYASNPALIEEKRENWSLDLKVLIHAYGISPDSLDMFLKNQENKKENSDVTIELFNFLKELNYPIDIIRDFDFGYKPLLPSKELKRITKTFLTLDDLRKTKKYSPYLIALDKELIEFFEEEIKFMESYMICQTCSGGTVDNEYFLNIDILCIQLYGKCPTCSAGKKQILMNYGFIHKMKEIQTYLNK